VCALGKTAPLEHHVCRPSGFFYTMVMVSISKVKSVLHLAATEGTKVHALGFCSINYLNYDVFGALFSLDFVLP
jgi:hypothetical protein